LLVRIEAFGEFIVFQHDILAHVIYFLISGFTPIRRSFTEEIATKAEK